MLRELAEKYGTDKAGHGFCEHYERRFAEFREEVFTLLEIGTFEGASMRMWSDYFPNATIVGIDHQPAWEPTEAEWPRIHLMTGGQTDLSFLNNVINSYGPFRVIIDDGGHQSKQHVLSFGHLMNHVIAGGWYAIEDCHSVFNPAWTDSYDQTILEALWKRLPNVLVGGHAIQEVSFVGGNWNDGLVFCRKRWEAYRGQQ